MSPVSRSRTLSVSRATLGEQARPTAPPSRTVREQRLGQRRSTRGGAVASAAISRPRRGSAASTCSSVTSRGSSVRGAHQPLQRRAHQPRRALQPLDVAAEPEQVVGHPARQVAGGAAQLQRRHRLRRRADDVAAVLAQHPDILGHAQPAAAAGQPLALVQHPREPARHGPPARAVVHQEQPQHHRPRRQRAVLQAGRDRGRDRSRRPPRPRAAPRSAHQLGARRRRQRGRRDRGGAAVHRRAISQRAGLAHAPRRAPRVAQPQRRHARQHQLLAEQAPAQRRQEGGQRRRLQPRPSRDRWRCARCPARTASIRPGTPSRLPASSSSGSIMPPVQPAQQHVDLLQPLQRLEEHRAAAHRQVAALDQRAGQFARRGTCARTSAARRCRGSAGRRVGFGRPRGPSRRSASCQMSKNGRSWRTCTGRNASGSTRASRRRFSRA